MTAPTDPTAAIARLRATLHNLKGGAFTSALMRGYSPDGGVSFSDACAAFAADIETVANLTASGDGWRDIIVPQLKPEARYLVFVDLELDKDYRRKQWYAASYHTDGGKKSWFIVENASYWLNKIDSEHRFSRALIEPSQVIAIKPMPLDPGATS